MTDRDSQLTSSVLMIRPTCFYGNPLTATSNRFQVKTDVSIADQLKKALEEFELFTIALKKCGVELYTILEPTHLHVDSMRGQIVGNVCDSFQIMLKFVSK